MSRTPHPRKKSVTRWYKDGKQVKPHTEGATSKVEKTDTYYAFVKIDGKPRGAGVRADDGKRRASGKHLRGGRGI